MGLVHRVAPAARTEDAALELAGEVAVHPPEAVAYTKEICRYLWETYGRFPAHVDAFYVPGIWVQFSHLEIEYYEKYFKPSLFTRQELELLPDDEYAQL